MLWFSNWESQHKPRVAKTILQLLCIELKPSLDVCNTGRSPFMLFGPLFNHTLNKEIPMSLGGLELNEATFLYLAGEANNMWNAIDNFAENQKTNLYIYGAPHKCVLKAVIFRMNIKFRAGVEFREERKGRPIGGITVTVSRIAVISE